MRALANQERLTFRNAAASFGSSSTSLNSMAKLLFERPLSHRAAFLLRSSITASEILINWKGGAVRESREKLEWSRKRPLGLRPFAPASITGTPRVQNTRILDSDCARWRRNRNNIDICWNSPERLRIQADISAAGNLR